MKKLSQVILFNDLSGFGKCALSITVPVINTYCIETIAVPTAILSSNAKYPGFQIQKNQMLDEFINHLTELNISPDAVLCGYIADDIQAHRIYQYFKQFLGIKIFDPIMGDHGVLYKAVTTNIVETYKKIASISDIITPNLTEACLLAGIDYNESVDIEYLISKLHLLCSKTIIVKAPNVNYISEQNEVYQSNYENAGYDLFGTGDMFSSIIAAETINGSDIKTAVRKASNFITFVMKETTQYEDYERRGLVFEPYLNLLIE